MIFDFSLVLVVLAVISGVIWTVDRWFLVRSGVANLRSTE